MKILYVFSTEAASWRHEVFKDSIMQKLGLLNLLFAVFYGCSYSQIRATKYLLPGQELLKLSNLLGHWFLPNNLS